MDKADIEAIKEANPILDVLRDLGMPSQNNRIRCPRPENHSHGDRTPSVSVWPDRGQFKCWVCADVKGDVIDLVRLARGCTFREALEFLGRNSLGTAPLPRSGSARSPNQPAQGMPPSPTGPQPEARPGFAARPPARAHPLPRRSRLLTPRLQLRRRPHSAARAGTPRPTWKRNSCASASCRPSWTPARP